ncbi:F-box/kelch-repeat protein At3g23880-like [Gastrolobium bilobum]|uniref:F-box/kelch-repeat protein At3g23880-like n=1 Tax=Gastrolobium bilobum TaxID=150636 RepID=UPI002AAFD6D0|nr:F-box/kelch-repeat protein At3g23880-like [Gastrolobium bilobum]
MESELHHDLVKEIMLRLPVKSLVRFKCVCKSWHSHISDPHFAKSHYELSAAPSHRLLHITRSGKVSFIPPLLKRAKGKLMHTPKILGSCRGFVLIERYQNLYIWNPLTGFHRHLSYSDIGKQHHYPATLLIGFGYDPSTDDYLIVVLWGKYRTVFDHDDMQTSLVLFSFRTNSWKESQRSRVPYDYIDNNQSFLFNDAVHWLACGENEPDKVILAFDLVKKNFYEISLPDGDFIDGFYSYNFVKIGECLGLCDVSHSKNQVWVMKEYKVKSSWTMFEIPDYLSDVSIAIAGELVVLCHANVAELMKFNEKGELLELCKYYCNDVCGQKIAMYTESLLSLPRNSD